MLSQLFNRSTAIFRNAFGYRPTARFFATCSPFHCIVCQLRVSQLKGSVQFSPVSAWGKEAGLELEEVKTLLRHENLATTSEVYGDLGMEAKRRIQQQLVNFVKQQATRAQ